LSSATPPISTLSLPDALPIFLFRSGENIRTHTETLLFRKPHAASETLPEVMVNEGRGVYCTPRPIRCISSCTRLSEQSAAHGCRSEEHTSEVQSRFDLVCRLL